MISSIITKNFKSIVDLVVSFSFDKTAPGGVGGGGTGGSPPSHCGTGPGTNGTATTGGGAGAMGSTTGGSGIVIIRYKFQ